MFSQGKLLLSNEMCLGPHSRDAPSALLRSATQVQLKVMMHVETGKLLELREELEKEMEVISPDFISTRLSEVETYLDQVKVLKNAYQDEVEDFVDKYIEVLENPHVLDEWTKEVREIAEVVKKHAHLIRTKAMEVTASANLSKPDPVNFSKSEKAAISKWMIDFTKKHGIGEQLRSIQHGQEPSKTNDLRPFNSEKISASSGFETQLRAFFSEQAEVEKCVQHEVINTMSYESGTVNSCLVVAGGEDVVVRCKPDPEPPDKKFDKCAFEENLVSVEENKQCQLNDRIGTVNDSSMEAVFQEESHESVDPCPGAEVAGQDINLDLTVRVKKPPDRMYQKLNYQKGSARDISLVDLVVSDDGIMELAAMIKKPPDILDEDLLDAAYANHASLDPPPFRMKKPPDRAYQRIEVMMQVNGLFLMSCWLEALNVGEYSYSFVSLQLYCM